MPTQNTSSFPRVLEAAPPGKQFEAHVLGLVFLFLLIALQSIDNNHFAVDEYGHSESDITARMQVCA